MTSQEDEKCLNDFLKIAQPTREEALRCREALEREKQALALGERNYEKELAELEAEEEDLERESKNFELFIAHAEQLEKLRQQNLVQEKRLPLTQRECAILLSVMNPMQMVSLANGEKKHQLVIDSYKNDKIYYMRVNDPNSGALLMEQKIPCELLAQ